MIVHYRTARHPEVLGKYVWHCDLCGMEVRGFLTIKELEADFREHHRRAHEVEELKEGT